MKKRVKSLAPDFCPHCEAEDSFAIKEGEIYCRRCGFKFDTPPSKTDRRHFRVSYHAVRNGDLLGPHALAIYHTALAAIERRDWTEAIDALYRLVKDEPRFLDAHLWLARLLDDPQKQREHLQKILDVIPNHLEALREQMVLDGELTPEQADDFDFYHETEEQAANAAVVAKTRKSRCPRCGSTQLNGDEEGVYCDSCNYQFTSNDVELPGHSLTRALIRRRVGAEKKWVIGERLIHCDSCGAERTIPADDLSEECLFCGSRHVLQCDALASFQQPDALIPFTISRKQAVAAIKLKLSGWSEYFAGLFGQNQIEKAEVKAVYLPYWVFSFSPNTRTWDLSLGQDYVPVCAVKSPSKMLTSKLGGFDVEQAVDYEPELLARYPAELYTIDFEEASLEAYSILGALMEFRLMLMPVWIATLTEEDGDIRLALVNGQTGKVALGRPAKIG